MPLHAGLAASPFCRTRNPGDKDNATLSPTSSHTHSLFRTDPHQREFVGHTSIRRDLGTKAKGGEHLVAVVVLDDLAHRLEGHGVGVELVGAQVVQRGGLRGVPCAGSGLSQAGSTPAPSVV